MTKFFRLLGVMALGIAMPLLANVALPSMYEILGFSAKANGITLIGFALELLCVCIMARVTTVRLFGEAFFCTITMNAFSAIVGIILRLPLFALTNSIAFSLFGGAFNIKVLGSGLIMLLAFVVVNTLLEGYVARNLFFPKIPARQLWFWIMMANLLSNGTGLLLFARSQGIQIF